MKIVPYAQVFEHLISWWCCLRTTMEHLGDVALLEEA